jgi:beta-lactamase regulating signal transducer with metallopeptidase domain
MNHFHAFFDSNAVTALGWTLIHSLWQIALAGLLLKTGLFLTRNKSAEVRSAISSVSMVVIVIVSVVTFARIYSDGSSSVGIHSTEVNNSHIAQNQVESIVRYNPDSSGLLTLNRILNLINSNLTIIVTLWLTGMFIFSIRFAGSYLYIRRLKRRSTVQVTGKLFQTLSRFRSSLGIHKQVRLLESLLVRIPMVIGHLKPVIIIPAGLAAALPFDQVEAILAHEMAHIRRHDYFLNLVKSVFQVIYFYHPVIWWLSAEMEKERENCCDDITIRLLGNDRSLQSALISLQQFEQSSAWVAAAFYSRKYKLLNRIKRMKTVNQISQRFRGSLAGFIALFGGLIILTTTSAISPKSENLQKEYKTQHVGILNPNTLLSEPKTGSVSSVFSSQVALRLPDQMMQIPDTVKGKSGQSQEEKSKVTLEMDGNYNLISVKKDGKPLEGDEKKEFEAMVGKMKTMNEQEKERENQRLVLEAAEKQLQAAQEQIEKARQEYEKAMESYNGNLFEASEFAPHVMFWNEDPDKLDKLYKEIQVITDVESGETPKVYSYSFSDHDFSELPEDCIHEKEVVAAISADKLAHLDDLDRKIKMIEIEKEMGEHGDSKKIIIKHAGSDDLLETLKEELLNDGIIKSGDERMSFTITQDEVEVNGQKLSDELHKKYLKIYTKETGNKLNGDFKIVIKN